MTRFIHESSLRALKGLARDLPHAVILSGPIGIGLSGAAEELTNLSDASIFYTVLPEKNEKIDIESGTISVESIRRLYELTKTIAVKKRVIVIDYAERMGIQAQNAFLKLLEEPGENTHFVLLSHAPQRLLPTVLSRAQHIELRSISTKDSERLLDELAVKDEKKRAQLLFVAKGLPAELSRLALDAEYFEARAQIIRDARTFVQDKVYARLKLAQQYKDSRTGALMLLLDAMNLLELSIKQGKAPQISKVDKLLTAYDKIEANGNIRLQLAVAML